MPRVLDQDPSRHSWRAVRTQRSAYAFACGGLWWAARYLDAFGGCEHLVEGGGVLGGLVPDQKPELPGPARPGSIIRLRACCATQVPFGLVVAPRICTRRVAIPSGTAPGFGSNPIVSTCRKSPARGAFGRPGQEPGSRPPAAPRRRINTGVGQDRPPGAGRHPVAHADQFTLDTAVPPSDSPSPGPAPAPGSPLAPADTPAGVWGRSTCPRSGCDANAT